MNLTGLQKAAAQAIVNIFETGQVRGNYGDVTLMSGDMGQLTYGRSQTTLASGNLYLLIADYAARADGAYAKAMQPYLAALEARDGKLNTDMALRGLLKDAGDDPVMHEVQDAFFDRIYWDPAMRSAAALGVQSPLGAAIVYDSTVHGSWAHVRDMTRKVWGELTAIGERDWMAHYVDERRNWLATHPNALLHKTVYRMDAFKSLLGTDNWTLALAFAVRGLAINEDTIAGAEPVKVTADGAPRRLLALKSPPLSGADVTWLQQHLARAGIKIEASGHFDDATDQAVRAFQQNHDLKSDGVVGPVTRSALEDLSVIAPVEAADEPMPAVATPVVAALPIVDAPPAAALAPPAAANPVVVATTVEPAPEAAPQKHETAPVAYTAPVPVPQLAAAPVPQPVAAQIKQHVTGEIASVKTSVDAQQARIVQNLMAGNLQGALAQIDQSRSLFQRLWANGRGFLAAFLSLVTLLFTEGRDLFAWGAAQLPPSWTAHAPDQQFLNQARDWGAQAYTTLHNYAAMVPAEWMFRLRVAALVLIAYAVMRFARRHKAAAVAK
jgi:chitosanase